MKAIETRYYGPTNTRGSRIRAFDLDGNSVSIPYPYDLSGEGCHAAAAKALCKKMNWHGKLASGALERGYVFVWCIGGDYQV